MIRDLCQAKGLNSRSTIRFQTVLSNLCAQRISSPSLPSTTVYILHFTWQRWQISCLECSGRFFRDKQVVRFQPHRVSSIHTSRDKQFMRQVPMLKSLCLSNKHSCFSDLCHCYFSCLFHREYSHHIPLVSYYKLEEVCHNCSLHSLQFWQGVGIMHDIISRTKEHKIVLF